LSWKGSRNSSRSLPHCHFCCLILCFNLFVFLYLQTNYDAFIYRCYPFEIKCWWLWVSLSMKLFLLGELVLLRFYGTIYSSFVGCFEVVMFYGGFNCLQIMDGITSSTNKGKSSLFTQQNSSLFGLYTFSRRASLGFIHVHPNEKAKNKFA